MHLTTGIYGIESRCRLRQKSHIIIIGGTDDGELRCGIHHTPFQTVVELALFLLNTVKTLLRPLTIVIELTVA